MKQKPIKPLRNKIIKTALLIIGVILSIPLVIILLYMGWSAVATYKDKSLLNSAAKEIQLPSNFVLTGTTFEDEHCLDTCAYLILHYRSADGKPLDREIVNKEVERNGYEQQANSIYGDTLRYKNFKGASIKTQQLGAPPEELNLWISK